jgi:heme exporter protein B
VIAAALTLAGKDLRLELRRREVVLGMAQFVMVTLVIVHFALVALGEGPAQRAASGMLWIAVLFTALLALGRAFAADHEDGAIDALLLAPVDRSAIWLGKVLSQLVFLAAMELIAVPAFWLFFFQTHGPALGPVLAALALADIGIAAIGVLVSSLAQAGRARDVLLPVLLLPLLVPLVLAAVVATLGSFPGGDGAGKALGFLGLFDTLFVLLAWGTYEHLSGD